MARLSRRLGRAGMCLAAGIVLLQAGAAHAGDTFDWYHNAEGYAEAHALSVVGDRPLILYFYTDWCGWCRRLKREYLDRGEVDEALAPWLRVDVNPEKGDEEKKIAQTYGITGYPTFLIVMPGLERKSRLYPFRKDRDQPPGEFAAEITSGAVTLTVLKGFAHLEAIQLDKALHLFQRILRQDAGNADAHYGMAEYYWKSSGTRRDRVLLARAEKEFVAALEANPNHVQAREGLARLRRSFGK